MTYEEFAKKHPDICSKQLFKHAQSNPYPINLLFMIYMRCEVRGILSDITPAEDNAEQLITNILNTPDYIPYTHIIHKYFKDGTTITKISKEYNVTPSTIAQKLRTGINKLADEYCKSILLSQSNGEILPEHSILVLNLSMRSFNCLMRYNIHTIQDLLKYTEKKISHIRNMGTNSLSEIIQKLGNYGLTLKEHTHCDIESNWRKTTIVLNYDITQETISNILNEISDESLSHTIILDFAKVRNIDASVIKLFINLTKKGEHITITNYSQEVKEILLISDIDKIAGLHIR